MLHFFFPYGQFHNMVIVYTTSLQNEMKKDLRESKKKEYPGKE